MKKEKKVYLHERKKHFSDRQYTTALDQRTTLISQNATVTVQHIILRYFCAITVAECSKRVTHVKIIYKIVLKNLLLLKILK